MPENLSIYCSTSSGKRTGVVTDLLEYLRGAPELSLFPHKAQATDRMWLQTTNATNLDATTLESMFQHHECIWVYFNSAASDQGAVLGLQSSANVLNCQLSLPRAWGVILKRSVLVAVTIRLLSIVSGETLVGVSAAYGEDGAIAFPRSLAECCKSISDSSPLWIAATDIETVRSCGLFDKLVQRDGKWLCENTIRLLQSGLSG